ncbi:MAG: 50S ribosomal protein L10 [Nanoarchaeota archaeon]
MAHVAPIKKETVAKFAKLLVDYPIVGMVNLENLPAKQLQTIRGSARNKMLLCMTKRRLMKLAFKEAEAKRPGISKLLDHSQGMPALMFSCENPFSLYKFLQKNKSPAPAKAGMTSPRDIVIPAGPTSFAPGPIIGELGQLRIKAGVEGNKVVIKVDATIVEAGEKISQKVADLLVRFGIMPMEVGLDLVAVYEKGEILGKDLLGVDEAKYIADIGKAAAWAMSLAVEAGYASKDTVEVLLGKAHQDAKAVGIEAGFLEKDLVGDIFGKAEATVTALAKDLKLTIQ